MPSFWSNWLTEIFYDELGSRELSIFTFFVSEVKTGPERYKWFAVSVTNIKNTGNMKYKFIFVEFFFLSYHLYLLIIVSTLSFTHFILINSLEFCINILFHYRLYCFIIMKTRMNRLCNILFHIL